MVKQNISQWKLYQTQYWLTNKYRQLKQFNTIHTQLSCQTEHEILNAHKDKNIKKFGFFRLR